MDETRLRKARLKAKFRPFATQVRQATGLALKMPNELFDTTKDEDIPLMWEVLSELKIRQAGNYWEAK